MDMYRQVLSTRSVCTAVDDDAMDALAIEDLADLKGVTVNLSMTLMIITYPDPDYVMAVISCSVAAVRMHRFIRWWRNVRRRGNSRRFEI